MSSWKWLVISVFNLYYFYTLSVDTTPPMIIGTTDLQAVYVCDNIPDVPLVYAIDSCDGNVTVTLTEVPPSVQCDGIMTRTWTSSDSKGNKAKITHTYTILPVCQSQLQISEVVATNGEEDFIELRGIPNFNLNGYALLALNGYASRRGRIDFFTNLNGVSLGPNGLLLVKNSECCSSYSPPSSKTTILTNGGSLNHIDSLTILLVKGWSGGSLSLSSDIDSDNDGVIESTPWTSVVDVLCFKRDANDIVYLSGSCPLSTKIDIIQRTNTGFILRGTLNGTMINDFQNETSIIQLGTRYVSPGSFNNIIYGNGGNY